MDSHTASPTPHPPPTPAARPGAGRHNNPPPHTHTHSKRLPLALWRAACTVASAPLPPPPAPPHADHATAMVLTRSVGPTRAYDPLNSIDILISGGMMRSSRAGLLLSSNSNIVASAAAASLASQRRNSTPAISHALLRDGDIGSAWARRDSGSYYGPGSMRLSGLHMGKQVCVRVCVCTCMHVYVCACACAHAHVVREQQLRACRAGARGAVSGQQVDRGGGGGGTGLTGQGRLLGMHCRWV